MTGNSQSQLRLTPTFMVVTALFATCLISANIIAVKPVVAWIKRREGLDHYDCDTSSNPTQSPGGRPSEY